MLAEELAQEALLVACRRWGMVGGLDEPLAWIHRVGVNQANSWFRRARAERRAYARVAGGGGHRDPDTADRVAVREALAALSPKQREAVLLRYYLGLSAEQAARATGSTPGAVRGLTHRAVRVLRTVLDVTEPEETADAR